MRWMNARVSYLAHSELRSDLRTSGCAGLRPAASLAKWRVATVGEPAEGSLTHSNVMFVHVALWPCT